jgi:hypothetical protein
MHPKKISNVLQMDGPARYDYFVRIVADSEQIWGLNQEGWAAGADDDGSQGLPLWPEKEFAQMCAEGDWAGYVARPIELHAFVQEWIPNLQSDAVFVAVFPTPGNEAVFVEATRIGADLERECERYE